MDREALKAFIARWTEMVADAYAVAVVALADQTDLLRVMAGSGPLTVHEIAERADLDPRMAREALTTLVAAGIVEFDDPRFELPDEQAAVLVDDTGPYFMASHAQALRIEVGAFEELVEALQTGHGVPIEAYGPALVENAGRLNGPSLRILLTKRWLPAVPGLAERLADGIDVADVGCGTGAATVAMAKAYPQSRFVGYDIDARVVERANEAGASLDNLSFERRAATDLPEDHFDFVLAFDVIHDLGNPLGALESIRRSLREGGSFLMVEPKVADHLSHNRNPVGTLFYGVSTLYCLPTSMAQGDAALGAAWGPTRAEKLATEAGFEGFEPLPIENPFQAFYLLS